MGIRRKCRELVVQTFYGLNFVETDSFLKHLDWIDKYKPILDNLVSDETDLDSSIYQYAEHFINGIIPRIDEIDELLDKVTGDYQINKLGMLEHIILRLAIFEILFEGTPAAVAIDESVEIAKKFCTEKSPSQINAILDKIKEYRG